MPLMQFKKPIKSYSQKMTNQTNITLIGYGKMGQIIHKLIQLKFPQISDTYIIDKNDEINQATTAKSDLFIDFSHPSAFVSNLEKLFTVKPSAKIVVGTTGWYQDLEKVQNLIAQNPESALIYSGNFSIGVNLFWKVIAKAAEEFNNYSDLYDVFGHELHHNQKADSPSGTAKQTAEILLKNSPTKTQIKYDLAAEKINPTDLHFSSTRGGHIIGVHSAYFDSEADTIEITHTARNREGFALGGIKAALWIKNKTGFFTIDDFINSYKND